MREERTSVKNLDGLNSAGRLRTFFVQLNPQGNSAYK